MLDIEVFLFQQRPSDSLNVMEQCFSLDVSVQNRVVYFKRMPVLLTDREASALGVGLVDEQRATIEASLVGPNHGLAGVPDLVLDLLIDLISDVIKTLFDEDDFVDVIKLCEDNVLVPETDWVKLLQELNHKVLVLEVVPGIEGILVGAGEVGDAEVPPEFLEKADEHEMSVNLALDLAG